MRNGKVILFSAILLLFSSVLAAQQPVPPNQQQPPMQMQPGQMKHMHGDMPGMQGMDCQAMMDKMAASNKAMDDRLSALVSYMNKARGSAKVDRMAAVINELITQRKQMRDDMQSMMPQMMSHMMQHMQGGMMQSMMACPMMKGDKPATPAPSDHVH